MFGEDLSDANLLRRVKKSDRRAFAVLVRRHDPALRQLADRLLVDTDRLDPVLLKAYGKAWRTANMTRVGSQRDDSVFNWLYRLVYNACVDELLRQPQPDALPPPEGQRVRLPKAPEERRRAALRALPVPERIALVLMDGEGFSREDAARILQRPPARVAVELQRARCHWRDLVIGPPVPSAPAAEGTGEDAEGAVDDAETSTGRSHGGVAAAADPTDPGGHPDSGGNGADGTATGPLPPAAPTERRSPEITDPEDVVYAAEGAFDSDRFSSLKQWFKGRGREESPTS